jgi:NAD(P)-dependent dehydrogenase (short-subunit alcohol dehydrogenase family)
MHGPSVVPGRHAEPVSEEVRGNPGRRGALHATVLLIGASRGLGYAIAAEYVERGSHVVATVRGPDRTARHELHETAADRLSENVPHLVTTIDAQRGRTGLHYLDYLDQTVAWWARRLGEVRILSS